MLEKYGYRHTHRMYNNDCFSTATIVKLTFLRMTFILTLPLLFYYTQRLEKLPCFHYQKNVQRKIQLSDTL